MPSWWLERISQQLQHDTGSFAVSHDAPFAAKGRRLKLLHVPAYCEYAMSDCSDSSSKIWKTRMMSFFARQRWYRVEAGAVRYDVSCSISAANTSSGPVCVSNRNTGFLSHPAKKNAIHCETHAVNDALSSMQLFSLPYRMPLSEKMAASSGFSFRYCSEMRSQS